MKSTQLVRIAAAVMAAGIALGAFGAHGFEEILERNDRVDIWDTAVKYHLVHGVALLVVALSGLRAKRGPFWCWLIGIVLFSGSLYALALTNVSKLGAITPLGGVLFLVGWIWLMVKAGTDNG